MWPIPLSDGPEILDEHLPDIIFLDNNLPDGYGWDKTDYILSTYPQTQLNLISALNVRRHLPLRLEFWKNKCFLKNFLKCLYKMFVFKELNRIQKFSWSTFFITEYNYRSSQTTSVNA